jgi:putative membrane protein
VTTRRSRGPRRVYAVGSDPDPRFSLANERTFLAWIRTALALLGAAVAIDVLELDLTPVVQRVLGSVLCLSAAVVAALAWRGWSRAERAMRLGLPLPAPPVRPVAVGLGATAGLCLVLLFVL